MNQFKNIVLVCLFAFSMVFSPKLQAQQSVKSFPYSSEEYYATLEEYFKNPPDKYKKEAKILLKDLEEKWVIGYFSDEIKERIYETSNLMLANKMRAFPFFLDYFNTIMAAIDNNISELNLENWMLSADFVLKTQKNTAFTEFLFNSSALFTENVLFTNRIISWKANANWNIEVDTNIRIKFQNTDLVCETKKDSSNIYATSGIYYPIENILSRTLKKELLNTVKVSRMNLKLTRG